MERIRRPFANASKQYGFHSKHGATPCNLKCQPPSEEILHGKSYISGDDDEYLFERLSLHEEDVPRFVVLDEHDRVEFLRHLHRHGSQGSTRTARLELAFAQFKSGCA